MHLFPAIDLREGKVVRLKQGDYGAQTTYAHDPVWQAQEFARAGASWVHVVDLDGARSGQMTQLPVIARLCKESGMKVQVGGGVRSAEVIDRLLEAGVTRAVLGTAALENWAWFEKLAHEPRYRQRLVLGLDARGGHLAVSGWEKQLSATPLEIARRVSPWPLAAIVYTDISVDGMMSGPNLNATRELSELSGARGSPGVPIIASGGVGTLEHLKALKRLKLAGIIVGKALYEGAFTVQDAANIVEKDY